MQVRLFIKKKKDLGSQLIKTGAIFLFSLQSSALFSRIPDFQTRLYNPFSTKNIEFEIQSTELSELFQAKYKITLGSILVKRNKQKFSVNLSTLNLSKAIKKQLKINIIEKANIVTGSNLKDWLESYRFIEEQNGWYIYEDKDGLLDNKVVKLRFADSKIKFIEKTSIGTNRTTYSYSNFPWSKKLVLSSVKKEMFDGLQKIFVNTALKYKEKNGTYFVYKIEQNTRHLEGEALGQKIEREINETYLVNNLRY